MADVKLLASQRLTDNPDGGGLMTSTEIVDGVVNNLWPDISRVDRAYGVVNLRKLYAKADTADTAIYSGLHMIVLFPPQDPRVTVTMFTTNNWADERSDAQSAVERYLDESVTMRLIPFDRQLAGQRTILGFQRPELDLPEIGQVYVISALPNETVMQFVRVSNLDHSVQTFTDPTSGVDFKARVITLTLTEPLTTTFQGSQPTRFFIAAPNTSQMRRTIVSDAVNYHTVHALAADAAIGDQTIKLGTIFTQLVPASTSESALIGLPPGGARAIISSGPSVDVSIDSAGLLWQTPGEVSYLPCAIVPGSARLYKTTSSTSLFDDGAGNLRVNSITGAVYAALEYDSGKITLASTLPADFTGVGWHAVFTPAVAQSKAAQTFQQRVTTSTRGYVYIATLHPAPTPGSLQVSFRSLGRWYTLTDDGTGALTGDVGIGGGSINFASAVASVSLGALPDIGSSIIWSWGGSSEYEIKTGDLTIGNPVITSTLTGNNAKPSTITATWTSGGITKTATDNGSGSFTGDATGHVVYGNGAFTLKPTLLPDPTTTFNFSYQNSAIRTELFNPTKSGSTITVTVAHGPIRPKSILITYQQTGTYQNFSYTTTQQLADDGSGNLVDALGDIKAGAVVNYTTGAITFNPDFTVVTPTIDYDSFENGVPARTADPSAGYFASIARFGLWPTGLETATTPIGFINGTNVTVQYKEDSATDGAQTFSLAAPPLNVDLTPTISSSIVPGGMMFTLGGRTYVERSGSLYYGIDPVTNAGSLGGSVDFSSGIATITNWVGGASSTLSLLALLTQIQPLPIIVVTGRTPGSPLRPASFYLQANKVDGTLISATADVNGNIATSNMHGYVDVTTGVFSIAFGQYVLDSTLTPTQKAQPWYNPTAVDADGYYLVPDPVAQNSITYNAVVQVSLPLDSTILGIDPVRLPLDGRVQAVRNGYMLILHDTQVSTMPGGLTAGQVVTLPRDALEKVEVRDQTGTLVTGQVAGGATVAGAKYTADLVAGTITMSTPLDLSTYTQPLVATHRIVDASVVTDVQITGQVTVAEALTRGYTASNSLASTALIAPVVGGSVQANYNHLFSQQTWNSSAPNWTDAIVGSPTTAAYNDLTYPIQVLNRDAITEKWALVFTSSTVFNIVAQDLGVIGTGNTSTTVQPINPATGQPYFMMDWHGFGTGWATGNAIRFDTIGAGMPAWLARTVRSGPATYTDDRSVIEPRWDKS
jgi:hypothetical protein